jgi:hypothetical protein
MRILPGKRRVRAPQDVGSTMETAAYFRRQAGFLLRLCQTCTDESVVRNLELMAAEFHTKAIEAEFKLAGGAPASPSARPH